MKPPLVVVRAGGRRPGERGGRAQSRIRLFASAPSLQIGWPPGRRHEKEGEGERGGRGKRKEEKGERGERWERGAAQRPLVRTGGALCETLTLRSCPPIIRHGHTTGTRLSDMPPHGACRGPAGSRSESGDMPGPCPCPENGASRMMILRAVSGVLAGLLCRRRRPGGFRKGDLVRLTARARRELHFAECSGKGRILLDADDIGMLHGCVAVRFHGHPCETFHMNWLEHA